MSNNTHLVNREPRNKFCETETSKRIFTLLSYCHEHRDIGIIVGEPGVGKTTAIKKFQKESRLVHFCTMSPAISSMSASLRHICECLGVYVDTRAADIHRTLLVYDFSNQLLIVDEAQHLSDQTIDELRCIYDETGLAIVFCGNATFKSRFNNTRAASFGQFTSRVGMRLHLDHPTYKDMEAICSHFDVEGKQAKDFLTKHSKTSGGLRIVCKLIDLAGRLGENTQSIKFSDLKSAAQLLGANQ